MSDSKELEVIPQSAAVAVESKRAIEEIRASFLMAREFPRDRTAALVEIEAECQRYQFALVAMFSYPRAGETISDGSIRLAEAIAQAWGHLRFGFKVLANDKDGMDIQAFCHDLQSNNMQTREIRVEHKVMTKRYGIKLLTDPRDQYENAANKAMRLVRECIKSQIPRWVWDRAKEVVRETLRKGEKNVPFADRLRGMVMTFAELGVSKEMIERKLNHVLEETSPDEFVDLIGVFNALKNGEATRDEYFEFTKRPERYSSSPLNETLGIKKEKTDDDDNS